MALPGHVVGGRTELGDGEGRGGAPRRGRE